MLASMFNLDDRLAELRPSEAELRLARQLRDASSATTGVRPSRPLDGDAPQDRARLGGKPVRAAVG